VGLGNFWRFPGLTYKYGGFGNFCIPYLIALFFFGIPLLLMELGLGQIKQRGDVSVFRSIHRRLGGIGIASVMSSYIIAFYYIVIIAWSCVYVVASFNNPLPWSKDNTEWKSVCTKFTDDRKKVSRAEEYFYLNVAKLRSTDTCEDYKTGDASQFSEFAFGATVFTWLCVFLAIFRGVHGSSWIVWFTVPIPLLFIITMVINGLTLDGHQDGIKTYFEGDAVVNAQIDQGAMWADAIGQIFFSIGVCMGIMTSYGSYNKRDKPIIADNFIIAITNSGVSFVSGFAVWSVVGYLNKGGFLPKVPKTGVDLVFIAYPTAIDEMGGKNFWAVLLGLTLFLLGVDSAFAMVEAVATVLWDMPTFKSWNRTVIAALLCVFGVIVSAPFCTNWGYILFDVVDHYLANYLLYIVGILQCFGCGWCYDWDKSCAKGEKYRRSLKVLTYGFWVFLFIVGCWATSDRSPKAGMLYFMGVVSCVVLPASYWVCDTDLDDWYVNVVMCGVHKISYSMSSISRRAAQAEEDFDASQMIDDKLWWEPIFALYFCLTVKYIIPGALWFVVLNSAQLDIDKPYGGYDSVWQWLGLIVPLIGLVIFALNICFCLVPEGEEEILDDANEKLAGDKTQSMEIEMEKRGLAEEGSATVPK